MAFEVGQRIVCVDDSNRPGKRWYPGADLLKQGTVYVVRQAGLVAVSDGSDAIRLVGLTNNVPSRGLWDIPYRACRFEAMPRKSTSIEVFRKMLLPSIHRETV